MVQIPRKNSKVTAISLRKQGFSYSEIMSAVSVSKSTLSLWLKGIELSEIEEQRLLRKRNSARRRGVETRKAKASKATEEIVEKSAEDIKEISKKELWLMGIVLYWRENFSKRIPTGGVHFTSSDIRLIKLFLKWLKEIGNIQEEEIAFDIFVKNEGGIGDPVGYWSRETGFSRKIFSHVYFQTPYAGKNKKKTSNNSGNGFLRIRVKSSSMLARQIAGWIKGIESKIE